MPTRQALTLWCCALFAVRNSGTAGIARPKSKKHSTRAFIPIRREVVKKAPVSSHCCEITGRPMTQLHRPRCPLTLVVNACPYLVGGHCFHGCWSGHACPAYRVSVSEFQMWHEAETAANQQEKSVGPTHSVTEASDTISPRTTPAPAVPALERNETPPSTAKTSTRSAELPPGSMAPLTRR